jgi:hypothetical protein
MWIHLRPFLIKRLKVTPSPHNRLLLPLPSLLPRIGDFETAIITDVLGVCDRIEGFLVVRDGEEETRREDRIVEGGRHSGMQRRGEHSGS